MFKVLKNREIKMHQVIKGRPKPVRNGHLFSLNPKFKKIQIATRVTTSSEVVIRVAGSLEAGGLPGYPEVLFVEINVMKSDKVM
jgi:hypothetical protein